MGTSEIIKMSDMYSIVENSPSASNIIKVSDLTGKNITYRFITSGNTGSAGPTLL
jgi:hypothetical protein